MLSSRQKTCTSSSSPSRMNREISTSDPVRSGVVSNRSNKSLSRGNKPRFVGKESPGLNIIRLYVNGSLDLGQRFQPHIHQHLVLELLSRRNQFRTFIRKRPMIDRLHVFAEIEIEPDYLARITRVSRASSESLN